MASTNEPTRGTIRRKGGPRIVVALIEDQMLAFLEAEEEKRCRDLEESKGKKVKRRTIDFPWQRGTHPQLCQETDLLLMVSEYDYDLENSRFQDYCRSRGVLHVAGVPGSERWSVFRDPNIGEDEFLGNSYFRFSEAGKEYTSEQMKTQWEIVRIGRAKLEDCWELYTSGGGK